MKVATIVILAVLVTVGAEDSIQLIEGIPPDGNDNETFKNQEKNLLIKDLKDMDKPVEVPDGGTLKVIEPPLLALSCLCGKLKDGACSIKNKKNVYLDASESKEGWPTDLSEADPTLKADTKADSKTDRKPDGKANR